MQITGIQVLNDAGTATYSITAHEGGVLYCTCPAWKNQKKHQADRMCKHIRFVSATLSKKVRETG